MLFGLTSQCFTGDTLVSTEYGLRPIEEIQAGDYVWSENTETGEKELKKVLGVSVTETTVLVHVYMEDGTEINTTENHPFYVEGKGWCAASGLEDGDILHAQDGSAVTVKDVEARQLDEAVKVYNLEIEEYHTYYVSGRKVLVHNVCDVESGSSSRIRVDSYDNMRNDPNVTGQAHHLSQNAVFKNAIPQGDGLCVELNGNAFSEIGSPHYEAHRSLERFWNQYRTGGELAGDFPTIGEYNRAVYNSLLSTNKFTPQEAAYAVRRAYGQQRSAGFTNSDFVPRIPGKLPQKK